jgi:hypothetical protein
VDRSPSRYAASADGRRTRSALPPTLPAADVAADVLMLVAAVVATDDDDVDDEWTPCGDVRAPTAPAMAPKPDPAPTAR